MGSSFAGSFSDSFADLLGRLPRSLPRRHPSSAADEELAHRVPSVTPAARPGISFEDRMATIDFRVGMRAHITVDSDVCRSCTTKACVHCCPANLFVPVSDGGVLFNYEQCFECGTCYMVCNNEGAIEWTYPDGGNGVAFRRS